MARFLRLIARMHRIFASQYPQPKICLYGAQALKRVFECINLTF
jgi:hypothetical protein